MNDIPGCGDRNGGGGLWSESDALIASFLEETTFLFVSFWFWSMPGNAQGFLLSLRPGITPGGASGTILDA